MKRKQFAIASGAVIIYLALITLLLMAESSAPGATIISFGNALWYSLTTLTTVGYGDMYPVTAAGRLIGVLFQLMSLGILVAAIGALFSLIRGRMLPLLVLWFRRGRHWYLFSESNPRSAAVAEALERTDKKAVILFCDGGEASALMPVGIRIALTPEKLAAFQQGKGETTVFALSDDMTENERLIAALKDTPCRLCAMTDYEPDRLSDRLILFNPSETCARLYWNRFPLTRPDETVVLIGSGKYAEALLEQALMFNVLSPDQAVTYHVIGNFDNFRRNHPSLSQICLMDDCRPVAGAAAASASPVVDRSPVVDTSPVVDVSPVPQTGDRLIFSDRSWNDDLSLLKDADRLIFCDESVSESEERIIELKRYCPTKATVYMRGEAVLDGVTSFGSYKDLFTPELTLKTSLSRTARRLHELYRNSSPESAGWDELTGFLRRSNLAAADHLQMKVRFLLNGSPDNSLNDSPDNKTAGSESEPAVNQLKKAVAIWDQADPALKDACRRIEHERWRRFHLLNNWQYAPVRDNAARQHPLLLPFDELDPDDQAKDDYGWELLRKLCS